MLNWILKPFLVLLYCALPLELFWSIYIEVLMLLPCSFLLYINGDNPVLQIIYNYATRD